MCWLQLQWVERPAYLSCWCVISNGGFISFGCVHSIYKLVKYSSRQKWYYKWSCYVNSPREHQRAGGKYLKNWYEGGNNNVRPDILIFLGLINSAFAAHHQLSFSTKYSITPKCGTFSSEGDIGVFPLLSIEFLHSSTRSLHAAFFEGKKQIIPRIFVLVDPRRC